MKKIKVLLTILLVAIFAVCALGSGEDTSAGQGNTNETVAQGSVQKETDAQGSIGKYSVVIDSCRLAKDFEGKDVIIVKYIFSNVSDDNSAAFFTTFDETVYQAGVGLNEAYILDDSANYSVDNQTKEIKKGASLEVEVAYELNDTTTDVEIEVKELFSFDDTVIAKKFSIAG